jgi:hypothetical protein
VAGALVTNRCRAVPHKNNNKTGSAMNKLTFSAVERPTFHALKFTYLVLLSLGGCSSGPSSTNDDVATASAGGDNSIISSNPLTPIENTENPDLGAANAGTEPYYTIADVMQSAGPTVSSAPTPAPIAIQPAVTSNLSSKILTLTWQPAAGDDLGYYVYFSTGPNDSYQLAKQVTLGPNQLQQQQQTQLSAADDLGLSASETVCIAVSAWNTFGESSRSVPKCIQLPA